MKNYVYEHETKIKASVEDVFAWHEREGALFRLSPPWEPIELISREGGIQKGGTCSISMKTGGIPMRWDAEHIEYDKNRFFRDRQARGPFALWEHSHYFSENNGLTSINDHVEYRLPLYPFSSAALWFVRSKLDRMFRYREELCKNDIEFYNEYKPEPKTIVISGTSGVLGSALIPFLQTQGHRIIRLIRDRSKLCIGDVCWNPNAGIIEETFENADAVIHLTGEPIGEGRWDDAKKAEIIESRVKSTSLIAKTVAQMKNPPKTLICASAIGYYGGRGDEKITEDADSGDDFISEVCRLWEEAAKPAVERGIRVVFMRLGVVLTPAGGALERMYLPYKLGLGPVFGTGRQYMSFIALDDVLYATAHILETPSLSGAVNLTSPNAVTSAEFSDILAKFLHRPRFLRIPSFAVEAVFGQMGREVLLSGANVYPEKLLTSGFRFRYPLLEQTLGHQLGG